jgi:hypothetical protein
MGWELEQIILVIFISMKSLFLLGGFNSWKQSKVIQNHGVGGEE